MSSIDDVIDSTSTLIEEHVSLYKAQVHAKLTNLGLPAEFLDEIPVEHLLTELDTQKKRDTFYEKNFDYIPPFPVQLGSRFVTVKGNQLSKKMYWVT